MSIIKEASKESSKTEEENELFFGEEKLTNAPLVAGDSTILPKINITKDAPVLQNQNFNSASAGPPENTTLSDRLPKWQMLFTFLFTLIFYIIPVTFTSWIMPREID